VSHAHADLVLGLSGTLMPGRWQSNKFLPGAEKIWLRRGVVR
jgi:hypothetical protein